jgi:hypothetical protein
MIQATHNGVEIELEGHQQPHGMWKCDYTFITHPMEVGLERSTAERPNSQQRN